MILKNILTSVFLTCLFVSCSRPVARFVLPPQKTVLEEVDFRSASENASSLTWYVDGESVSNDTVMSRMFLHSGRKKISLEVSDGKKTSRLSRDYIVAPSKDCIIWIETNLGNMAFRLLESTPAHRDNFLEKIERGFFNGRIFHRVIEGFMIQAGQSKDASVGENPSPYESQTIPQEISMSNVHVRGALAAARMPDGVNPTKASSSTQFYIVQGRPVSEESLLNMASEKLVDYTEEQISMYLEKGGSPQLDMNYTVFGQLVYGDELIDKIAAVKTDVNDKPLENIIIQNIKLLN